VVHVTIAVTLGIELLGASELGEASPFVRVRGEAFSELADQSWLGSDVGRLEANGLEATKLEIRTSEARRIGDEKPELEVVEVVL
jgi:hypothetical protein